MNDELKQLIDDAAKLLGYEIVCWAGASFLVKDKTGHGFYFQPTDPERGDLMKVAETAKIVISYYDGWVRYATVHKYGQEHFLTGNYQSLALAILRAASAVLKARGE